MSRREYHQIRVMTEHDRLVWQKSLTAQLSRAEELTYNYYNFNVAHGLEKTAVDRPNFDYHFKGLKVQLLTKWENGTTRSYHDDSEGNLKVSWLRCSLKDPTIITCIESSMTGCCLFVEIPQQSITTTASRKAMDLVSPNQGNIMEYDDNQPTKMRKTDTKLALSTFKLLRNPVVNRNYSC